MYGLCSLPRIGQGLVCRSTDVRRDQRVHRLGSDISSCLGACACYLGNLSIEDTLLVGVNLKGRQHIDLLDQEQRSILLSQLLGYLS